MVDAIASACSGSGRDFSYSPISYQPTFFFVLAKFKELMLNCAKTDSGAGNVKIFGKI